MRYLSFHFPSEATAFLTHLLHRSSSAEIAKPMITREIWQVYPVDLLRSPSTVQDVNPVAQRFAHAYRTMVPRKWKTTVARSVQLAYNGEVVERGTTATTTTTTTRAAAAASGRFAPRVGQVELRAALKETGVPEAEIEAMFMMDVDGGGRRQRRRRLKDRVRGKSKEGEEE